MALLENLTPFASVALPSATTDGTEALVMVVSGRFQLPRAGGDAAARIQPSDEQKPVRVADEYEDDPATSSLKYEGQSAVTRPGTDVAIRGQAWTPGGRADKRVDVAIVIGPIKKTVAVFGERVWTQGAVGLTPTSPKPFVTMPLVWERAFGGADPGDGVRGYEPRNPVGRGFFSRSSDALYQPLPNLEDPRELISSLGDRPTPACFAPIARSWEPRKSYGGTYDAQWLEEIAPNWPRDFDTRFFQSAPPGLVATPHLRGDEAVGLSGVSPGGDVRFSLPGLRLQLKSYLRSGPVRRLMALDSVLIEPEEGAITLTWRATLALPEGTFEHEFSVVRVLAPWEAGPR
ncbi:MAG: DUF2169 domain-containing protein [Polyangiaceae bacterium]